MQSGELEEAVLDFQSAAFFATDSAAPFIALAECFVFMADLQSAIRHYRHALWQLQKRARRSEAAKQRGLLRQQMDPALFLSDGDLTEEELMKLLCAPPHEASTVSGDASPPRNAASSDKISPRPSAVDSKGISKDGFLLDENEHLSLPAVQRRLAGLLDALGLALFSMRDYEQAYHCVKEALALVTGLSANANASPSTTARGTSEEESEEMTVATMELHRCVYLIALGKEEEAERALEVHMERYPASQAQSAAMLVQLYCNRQSFRKARQLLDAQPSSSSNSSSGDGNVASRHAPTLVIAQHTFNTTYKRYRAKAMEKKDMGTLSTCIEVFPSDVELLFTRAQLYIAQGLHLKSVKDLFRCVKETNGSHKAAVETMTSVLFTMGSGLGEGSSSLEEAITYYSESLKWRNDNTLVLLARGDCYVKLEDYETALLDYRRILQIQPDDTTAQHRIASLHDLWGQKLYAMDDVRRAEAEFTNAIKVNDQDPVFYYHRALCRFKLGESRYGLRDVLSCQQLHPADPTLRAFLVRYLGSSDAPETSAAGQRQPHQAVLPRTSGVAATQMKQAKQGRRAAEGGGSVMADAASAAPAAVPCDLPYRRPRPAAVPAGSSLTLSGMRSTIHARTTAPPPRPSLPPIVKGG